MPSELFDHQKKLIQECLTCEVCRNESGGTFAGVACVPGAPISIAWCTSCLQHEAVPEFILRHDFIFLAEGNLDALIPEAAERTTWVDGKYITMREYVQRITPEEIKREHEEFEKALARTQKYKDEVWEV